MFVLRNSRRIPSYYGTRLTFLLSSIVELGRKYPDALRALRDHRDRCEKELLRGDGDTDAIDELVSINERLGEDRRTISFFVSLQGKREGRRHLSDYFLAKVCHDYARDKRYQVLSPIAPYLARWAVIGVADAHVDAAFADVEDTKRKAISNKSMIRAILAFEILLALDRRKLADRTKAWLLRIKKEEMTYRLLIEAASKAKKDDIRRALAKEAKGQFPGVDFGPRRIECRLIYGKTSGVQNVCVYRCGSFHSKMEYNTKCSRVKDFWF